MNECTCIQYSVACSLDTTPYIGPLFIAFTQCAVANNGAVQLQTAWYQNWYHHDIWQYHGIAIYRDLFNVDIKPLVCTIVINVS